ncbi:bifunctional demethylmenaquinone methyltransferase/2-methoxy-6-polyprenyl-1,4-benzoquinol methylase UbiE [Hyalangium sp.]|uniref:bifunctional demethylmenaquinone methyltransferase/2-methoxy-6-polyprenyl-1,4-benzoquinol methylase UbiE n=1 Tax=Hyalangium sp. TaxID=2028555 RepID=UPI002D3DCC61|nr:bifunctional demethylmenaquinone methyltransferase/2-methoxy-6-polyprenyl-1,4-benzoquinol methylase UbiE [Hyalangium sp.]HYH98241.1 bifunctional demethylmenaquinone methyltransferase/2-methoxy-6-polyprenyl-1,4-benzoquinol methylase UbiE [Hyalangium sp.]
MSTEPQSPSVPSEPGAAVMRAGSGAMFDKIARRYDLLNRLMSLGIDQRWRNKTVDALELKPGARVLDLATGTADLALKVLRRHPETTVVGVDPSVGMLEIGKQKVAAAGLAGKCELQVGDAQELPFPDRSFDGLCMAFGIRNVPDRLRALREMARVTKPDGRIAILELSEPRGGILGPLARFQIRTVVPWVGRLLSGAREYQYLQQSIAAFPPPEAFADAMREAGLEVLRVQPLTFGVCCLYVARPQGA